jgi:ankyrin repeat protein
MERESAMDELLEAAKAGDEVRVRRLLSASPDLARRRSESGESAVMAALYRGHTALAAEIADASGSTDVFAAAALGRTEALRDALVQPGQLDVRSHDGWTPLHLAAFFGHTAAADLLLASGADVDALSSNSMRNTPLHAAAAGGRTEAALLLVQRGADVKLRDAGGHTALHIAAENGDVRVVEALLQRGADPLAVDGEDKTPLSRAAARNHDEVVDLINVGPRGRPEASE